MTRNSRRRLIARINQAIPVLLVALFSLSIMGFVAVAWSALAEGTKTVKRSSGMLALPEKPTRALIARGDSIFHGTNGPGSCAVCHGEQGRGTRLGPSLATARQRAGDGDLESVARVIRRGVFWPPSLRPSMPAFEGALDREQIWAVAAYVYSISPRGN